MLDVVVVGGGISGLTCAYYAQRAGLTVKLFTGSDPGGAIQTDLHGAYRVERGPNSLRGSTAALQTLVRDLGLTSRIVQADPAAKERYILHNGRLLKTPSSPAGIFKTSVLPTSEKLRLFKEPFVRQSKNEDESIRDFVTRRGSAYIADHLADPVIGGIFAGDIEKLSIRSAFPKLWEMEQQHGSLLKGALKGRVARKKSRARTSIFSFIDGVQELPAKLLETLGASVEHSSVNSITQAEGCFLVEGTRAKNVVISTPASVCSKLIAPLSSKVARLIEAISHPHVAVVSLAFKRNAVGHPLDGFGFLVPSIEKRDILGCIFSSSLWPGRSPKDEVLLTVMLGGAKRPEIAGWGDQQIVQAAIREAASILDISSEPVFTHISRWSNAIPQYELGHHKIIREIEYLELAHPGLHILSNFRGGISIGSCVENAMDLANRLAK